MPKRVKTSPQSTFAGVSGPVFHVCNYANDYAKLRRATTLNYASNYATNYAADLGAHRLSSRGVGARRLRPVSSGRHDHAARTAQSLGVWVTRTAGQSWAEVAVCRWILCTLRSLTRSRN